MVVVYDNHGEGGFYDNLGTSNIAPHVVSGYPYDHGQPYVSQMLSEGNRPSQRSMHFTQNEKQGVTLHYTDLDPKAHYQIRFTFVRPWYQDRYAPRMNQKSQSIYADDLLLARKVELPYLMSDFFTYNIPLGATSDGDLTIRLEKAEDVAVGDRVSVEQWRNSGGWGGMVDEEKINCFSESTAKLKSIYFLNNPKIRRNDKLRKIFVLTSMGCRNP